MKREETSYKNCSPDERKSRTVLDSGFKLLDSDSLPLKLGLRIPIVSEFPDSWAEFPISKPRIPDCPPKKSRILNSSPKKFTNYGIWIPLLGAKLWGKTIAWNHLGSRNLFSLKQRGQTRNLHITKGRGTGKICSLYRGFVISGSFSYILLLRGWRKSFVIPRTSLCRDSLHRGSPNQKQRFKFSAQIL